MLGQEKDEKGREKKEKRDFILSDLPICESDDSRMRAFGHDF